MNIYVGNLSDSTSEDELREAFESFGAVDTVSLIKDKLTGTPRGFGFVEMPTEQNAAAAVKGLNGHDLSGRPLTVNEAKPREKRSSNGFGNNGNSGDRRHG